MKFLILFLTLSFSVQAYWTSDSNAFEYDFSDAKKRSKTLALDNPIAWEIEQGVIGNILNWSTETSKLTLFSMNLIGGWDIGYSYGFGYNIGEGINVEKDGYSNPQLMTRAEAKFGAKAWLKFEAPGLWMDFWKTNKGKSCGLQNVKRTVCVDIFSLLGVQTRINEELFFPPELSTVVKNSEVGETLTVTADFKENKSIDFRLPFFDDKKSDPNVKLINAEFKNGIYKDDYNKTLYGNLANLFSPAVSKVVTANIGIARGINGGVNFGLDSIKYYNENSEKLGEQRHADSGVSVTAGENVNVSKREYIVGIEPKLGIGMAAYTEVGVFGYSIAVYYPLEESTNPALVELVVTGKITLPAIPLNSPVANYKVPSSTAPDISTPSGQISIQVSPPSRGYIYSIPTGISCGTGKASCSVTIDKGVDFSLYASPNSGFGFQKWSGTSCNSSKSNPCLVNTKINSEISVNLIDIQPPIIIVDPMPIVKSVFSTNSKITPKLKSPAVFDNVDSGISAFPINKNSLTNIGAGIHYVHWHATDSQGNIKTTIQKIIIKVDNAVLYVKDTVRDDTKFNGGEEFTQNWTLRNVGRTTWDSNYCLQHHDKDSLGKVTSACVSGSVTPGNKYTFTVPMQAPQSSNIDKGYTDNWQLAKSGQSFSSNVWTKIIVKGIEVPIFNPIGLQTENSVELSWNVPAGVNYYRLFLGLSENGSFQPINEYNGTDNNYTMSGLDAGKNYFFKVQSCLNDSINSCSTLSNSFKVSTLNEVGDITDSIKNFSLSSSAVQQSGSVNLSAMVFNPGNVTYLDKFELVFLLSDDMILGNDQILFRSGNGQFQLNKGHSQNFSYNYQIADNFTTNDYYVLACVLYKASSSGIKKSHCQNKLLTITNTSVGSINTTISAIYLQDKSKFKVSWSDTNAEKLEILYSYDGLNFLRFSLVTLVNYQGNSVTERIPGHGFRDKIYFKTISTMNGVSTTSDILEVTYALWIDKGTEEPNVPELSSLGNRLGVINKDNLILHWKRVNDSKYHDNVMFYEMMMSKDSNFLGAIPVNVGNNAAGVNIYESCSYALTGLDDGERYYFRIRAVNNKGTSDWSDYESVKVEIEDLPQFDSYQYPENNATSISKLPTLRWNASDNDGDDLEYMVFWGKSANNLKYQSDWLKGDTKYTINKIDDKELKPNTTYYWQVALSEEGHYKDYYGGEYIKSGIKNFTTINAGPDLAITNIELLTELLPDRQTTFRVTISNIGTEIAEDESIRVYYKKGNQEWAFLASGWGYMNKNLAPNESEVLDIAVRFQDEVIISNGKTYNNILVAGDSQVVFKIDDISEQDINASNNELTKTIVYTDLGRPKFDERNTYLVGYDNEHHLNGRYVSPNLGDSLSIKFSAIDDILISKATIEYRLNVNDSWHLIETISNHGKEIAKRYGWLIPEDRNLITDNAQIRVRVYESSSSYTEKVFNSFPIQSNLLTLGIADILTHKVGDTFTISSIINNDYPISSLKITLFANGEQEELYEAKSDDGIDVNSLIQVSLPDENRFANQTAYLEIVIRDTAGNSKTIQSNNFILNAKTELSGIFGNLIDVYNQQYNYPAPPGKNAYGDIVYPPSYGIHTSTSNKVAFVEMNDNNIAHMIIAHSGEWRYNYYNGGVDDEWFEDTDYLYITYNYNTKVISSPIKIYNTLRDYNAPNNFPSKSLIDFKLVNGIPNILVYDTKGNKLKLYRKSGSSFSNQIISSSQNIDNIKFVENKDNYYVHYRYLPDSGVVADRRHKLIKIHPNIESEYSISPNKYLLGIDISFRGKVYRKDTGILYSTDNDLKVLGLDHNFGTQTKFINTGKVDLGDSYKIPLLSAGNILSLVDLNNQSNNILDISDEINLQLGSVKAGLFARIFNDIGIFAYVSIVSEVNQYKVSVVDLTNNDKQSIIIGKGYMADMNLAKLISVNTSKIMVIGQPDFGSAYIAIGDFSGDIIAPELIINNTEVDIENNTNITLNWTASDNQNQLVNYEVYKTVNGVESLLTTINNTQQVSYQHRVNESSSEFIEFKVVAYDTAGNSHYAILPLHITRAINFSSFSTTKTNISLGNEINFSWSDNGNSLTRYEIYAKKVGSAIWEKITRIVGQKSKNYIISDFVGDYNFKIVSGNYELISDSVVTINGELLKFNHELYSPNGNYFGSGDIVLAWNDALTTSVPYTVWIKADGESDFSNKGEVFTKSYTHQANTGDSFTWKVSAKFNDKQVVSNEVRVSLVTLPTPTIDNINFTNENNSPKVNINFSSVVGADSYIIQKGLDGNYEDITTTNTIFIDSNVEHAKKYTYKIFAKTNKFYSSPSSEVEVNTGYIFKSIGSENGLILENNCTNRCNSIYVPNSDIKLKAIANNGYKFNNWSGNCSGNANPLTITMNANKVCSAVFSLLVIGDQYIVNVSTTNGNINSNPSGINCGSDCDEVFNKNTVVSLTATPNSGYEFTDWGGSCSGNANPLTITINNNKSCAANFTLLNVDTDNDGHPDNQDAFPNDPNEWLDTDGDGTGNNADTDDDNDGMSDTWETVYGLNPLVDDSTGDLDNDGFTNLEEYQASTNPTDGADKPINYQQVYIQDNNKKINSGQNISLFVKYKTSDNDNTVSGLGMRIHYDASKLEQISITDIFGTPIGISSESENDGLTDYDNDSSTNRYYGIAWASVNSNWPNQRLPLDLFKFNFKVKDGLSVGEQTRLNFSSTSLSNGYTFQPTNSVLTVTNVTLDIDGDGSSDALTDGLLTLRYLFGFQDNTLIHNAIGANALRVSAANVKAFLDQNKLLLLDVDGNGSADALTDGLLILRYLFGFKDNTLINNAIGNGATRTTADEIKTYLQSVDL